MEACSFIAKKDLPMATCYFRRHGFRNIKALWALATIQPKLCALPGDRFHHIDLQVLAKGVRGHTCAAPVQVRAHTTPATEVVQGTNASAPARHPQATAHENLLSYAKCHAWEELIKEYLSDTERQRLLSRLYAALPAKLVAAETLVDVEKIVENLLDEELRYGAP